MNNVYHQPGFVFRFEAVHWLNDSAVCILVPSVIYDDHAQPGANSGQKCGSGWRIMMTLKGYLSREAASQLARRLNEAMR